MLGPKHVSNPESSSLRHSVFAGADDYVPEDVFVPPTSPDLPLKQVLLPAAELAASMAAPIPKTAGSERPGAVLQVRALPFLWPGVPVFQVVSTMHFVYGDSLGLKGCAAAGIAQDTADWPEHTAVGHPRRPAWHHAAGQAHGVRGSIRDASRRPVTHTLT